MKTGHTIIGLRFVAMLIGLAFALFRIDQMQGDINHLQDVMISDQSVLVDLPNGD